MLLGACGGGKPPVTVEPTAAPPAIYAVERSRGRATLYAPTGEASVLAAVDAGPPTPLGEPLGDARRADKSDAADRPDDAANVPPRAPAISAPATRATDAPAAMPDAAIDLVRAWSDQAAAIVNNGALSPDEKRRRLRRAVARRIDIEGIARHALGAPWDELSRDQRHDFVALFYETTLIDPWFEIFAGGGALRAIEARPAPGFDERPAAIRVRSVRTDGGESDAHIDWIVDPTAHDREILNVVTPGGSLRNARRAEFARYFRWLGGGIDRLLRDLRFQRDRLAAR